MSPRGSEIEIGIRVEMQIDRISSNSSGRASAPAQFRRSTHLEMKCSRALEANGSEWSCWGSTWRNVGGELQVRP